MPFLVTVLIGHLAPVFFGLIRVAASTTAVGDIDDIDFGGWGAAFSFLFSVLVAVVLLLLLSSLGMSFFRLLRG